jgi:hypothetical protein
MYKTKAGNLSCYLLHALYTVGLVCWHQYVPGLMMFTITFCNTCLCIFDEKMLMPKLYNELGVPCMRP